MQLAKIVTSIPSGRVSWASAEFRVIIFLPNGAVGMYWFASKTDCLVISITSSFYKEELYLYKWSPLLNDNQFAALALKHWRQR